MEKCGVFALVSNCYRHHQFIPERSLRRCQYHEAFIAPFPIKNNNILKFAFSVPNMAKAPLPTENLKRGKRTEQIFAYRQW
jgi:hypothetical protein